MKGKKAPCRYILILLLPEDSMWCICWCEVFWGKRHWVPKKLVQAQQSRLLEEEMLQQLCMLRWFITRALTVSTNSAAVGSGVFLAVQGVIPWQCLGCSWAVRVRMTGCSWATAYLAGLLSSCISKEGRTSSSDGWWEASEGRAKVI